jgi:putative toxin-antitoxin system antitoxin component (TIGR02293 family)
MSQMSYDSVSTDTIGVMEYAVGQILGLGEKTEAEMEEIVRGGKVPASALIELVRHISGLRRGPQTTAIAERIVSRATWNRALKNPRGKLSPAVADRVERVGRLVSHAETTWGDTEDARRFITSTQALLGGAPLDMAADSTVGARRAETLLGRIDHGIVV